MQKKSILESIDPRHLLVTIAEILEGLGVKYAVTGGMAVFVWGKPRFTADIDIVVQIDASSAKKLYAALERLSDAGYVSQEAVDRALERKGEFNFIDGASGVKVDFWVLDKDAFGVQQLKRRRGRKIMGKNIFFVSPEDLILSKLLWHKESESSKQQEDIASVLQMQKKLDWKYLRKWAKAQATLKILEPLLQKN